MFRSDFRPTYTYIYLIILNLLPGSCGHTPMAPVTTGAMVSGGYNSRKSNNPPESGWKHKNLPELASDGRTEETGFS